MVSPAFPPVIYDHVKTAGYTDEKLMAVSQRVPSPNGSARHIVQIKNSFDEKGDMPLALNEGEVSPRIAHSWQLD